MKPRLKNRFKIFKMKPLGNTRILYRCDKDLSFFKLSVRISLEKFQKLRQKSMFEILGNALNTTL